MCSCKRRSIEAGSRSEISPKTSQNEVRSNTQIHHFTPKFVKKNLRKCRARNSLRCPDLPGLWLVAKKQLNVDITFFCPACLSYMQVVQLDLMGLNCAVLGVIYVVPALVILLLHSDILLLPPQYPHGLTEIAGQDNDGQISRA